MPSTKVSATSEKHPEQTSNSLNVSSGPLQLSSRLQVPSPGHYVAVFVTEANAHHLKGFCFMDFCVLMLRKCCFFEKPGIPVEISSISRFARADKAEFARLAAQARESLA